MTFKPHIARKLYKTTLKKDKIKHPKYTPAQEGAGKDETWVAPVVWHFLPDGVFVTFCDGYLEVYNKENAGKFVIASSSDAKKVRATFDEAVRQEYDHAVTNKYTTAELAVPTDDMKTDMAAILKNSTDFYDAMVLLK